MLIKSPSMRGRAKGRSGDVDSTLWVTIVIAPILTATPVAVAVAVAVLVLALVLVDKVRPAGMVVVAVAMMGTSGSAASFKPRRWCT
jgi:hypothetical protein